MGKLATLPGGEFEAELRELERRIGNLERSKQGAITEDVHYVGDSGEPAFLNGFTHFASNIKVGFYKTTIRGSGQTWSTVRLVGLINPFGVVFGSPAFQLPLGYRPQDVVGFRGANAEVTTSNGNSLITITEDGLVRVYANGAVVVYVGMGGVQHTFQEAPGDV